MTVRSHTDSFSLNHVGNPNQPEFEGVVVTNVSVPSPIQVAQNGTRLQDRVQILPKDVSSKAIRMIFPDQQASEGSNLSINLPPEVGIVEFSEESSEDEGYYYPEQDTRNLVNNPQYQRNPTDGHTPTISPKGASPRFSEEWYAKTECLQPGSNRKPLPKLQVQKAASEVKKE